MKKKLQTTFRILALVAFAVFMWLSLRPASLVDGTAPKVTVAIASPVPGTKIALRKAKAGEAQPLPSDENWVEVASGSHELNPGLYHFRLEREGAYRIALIAVTTETRELYLK